jgi:hypothetical protein
MQYTNVWLGPPTQPRLQVEMQYISVTASQLLGRTVQIAVGSGLYIFTGSLARPSNTDSPASKPALRDICKPCILSTPARGVHMCTPSTQAAVQSKVGQVRKLALYAMPNKIDSVKEWIDCVSQPGMAQRTTAEVRC